MAFKYERIVRWCFACRRLGHEIKHCLEPSHNPKNGECSYGEWIKAGNQRSFGVDGGLVVTRTGAIHLKSHRNIVVSGHQVTNRQHHVWIQGLH